MYNVYMYLCRMTAGLQLKGGWTWQGTMTCSRTGAWMAGGLVVNRVGPLGEGIGLDLTVVETRCQAI